MPRLLLILLLAAAGCAATGPTREAETLSGVTQLTSGFASAENASFSPDLRYLIFTAQPWGSRDRQVYIAAVKFAGGRIVGLGAPTRVTPGGGTGGAFSPDGATVILACNGGLYRADGWRANLDAGPGAVVNLARNRLPTPEGAASNPAVSPDGRHLAFALGPPDRSAPQQIFVMRIDGSHPVRLAGDTSDAEAPAFSPDGRQIVYCDLDGIRIAGLIFDAADDPEGLVNDRHIVGQSMPLSHAHFHPDGLHIAFPAPRRKSGGKWLLPFAGYNPTNVLVRTDGTHRTRFTFGPYIDADPTFSPDGRYLLWTSTRAADGSPQVFVARFELPRGS